MSTRFKSTYWFLFFSLAFIAASFYFFSDIVAYVLISFVLSMVGQPLMRVFLDNLKWNKHRWGSPLAAIITLFLMFGILMLIVWLFIPLIVQQAEAIANVEYIDIENALQEPLGQVTNMLERFGVVLPTGDESQFLLTEALQDWYRPEEISKFLGSFVSLLTNVVIGVFSVAFITFFFLQEKGMFLSFLTALVPNQYEGKVQHAMEEIIILLRRYFAGVFLQITTITIIVSVGLSLFGIKNALLIGFFAAIINVIPYLGPIIGASFAVFITISSYVELDFYTEMLPLLFKVIGVFAIMQLTDNFLLQPLIFSKSVLAHPLEIFIIILIAGKLGGIFGMIVAIPVYTMIRVVAKTFLGEFKIVKKLTDRLEAVDEEE